MSRPKDADPSATRERILSCACELLSESNGDFSLRAVARKSQVSIGTLQYHFADKGTLVDACIDTVYLTISELAPTFAAQLTATENVEELIAEAVHFAFGYAREHRPYIRILEASSVQNGGLDLKRSQNTQQPFIDNISALLSSQLPESQQEIRLRLNSIVLLLGRYSIMEESSLLDIFTPEEGKTVFGTVEEHIVSMARRLLIYPDPTT